MLRLTIHPKELGGTCLHIYTSHRFASQAAVYHTARVHGYCGQKEEGGEPRDLSNVP